MRAIEYIRGVVSRWRSHTLPRRRYVVPARRDGEIVGYAFRCPGCGNNHFLPTAVPNAEGQRYIFNGDVYKPSFAPTYVEEIDLINEVIVCSFDVLCGHLDFHHNSTHKLSGRIVPMLPIDENFREMSYFS